MDQADDKKYWFHAKRYGWGWGLPAAWQGWVVLIVYLILMLGGIPLIHKSMGAGIYLAYAFWLTVLFVVICWLKGEPPRWRWGDRE